MTVLSLLGWTSLQRHLEPQGTYMIRILTYVCRSDLQCMSSKTEPRKLQSLPLVVNSVCMVGCSNFISKVYLLVTNVCTYICMP